MNVVEINVKAEIWDVSSQNNQGYMIGDVNGTATAFVDTCGCKPKAEIKLTSFEAGQILNFVQNLLEQREHK